MYEGICDAIHREMDELEKKYETGAQLSGQDLEHIDKMAHALKSLATYEAMKGNSEGSYARGRSRTTGRYISRDMSRDYPDYDRRY
jgi:hypothetical protein